MSGNQFQSNSSDDLVQSLIAEFLGAEGRGQPMDRQAWLTQHPEHADSLRDFLANHDHMKETALGAADIPSAGAVILPRSGHLNDDSTLPPNPATSATSRGSSAGSRLRYFGDYELLEVIAQGGMGIVYKARQINLNRIVALKMILAGQLASEQDVQRFRTEAESAANLDHPRIVPIYEVGQHAGQHYFSMGFVDGKSLAQKIVDGPLAPREAAEMLVKICEGIAYAHERGVIHRDLKPANILLDQNEQPKVTDFGLAKKLGSDSNLTGTGQILGTPSYMAPEQASGKIDEVGPPADVYSLGAILYCLLTGRPPFQAANPMETLQQVLDMEPISPRQFNTTIPTDLETICLRCLSKEPHRRYSSANELSCELGRFLRGEPILARPVGKLEQGWRWCKRNPAVASLSSIAGVLLVAGIVVSSIFALQANRGMYRANQLAKRLDAIAIEAMNETAKALAAEVQARDSKDVAEAALEQAEKTLARSNYLLAGARWKGSRAWESQELLRKVPREFRNFEWYLDSRAFQGGISLYGHADSVACIAFSPDGMRIASGSWDNTIKIWDAQSGEELRTLIGHDAVIDSLAFSPDGMRIVSGSADCAIKIWDAQSGIEIRSPIGRSYTSDCLGISPDGILVVSEVGDYKIKIWNSQSGEELRTLTGHTKKVNSFAFSPDGMRIASGSADKTIKIWDPQSGEEFQTLIGHSSSVNSIAFSPDGRQIASRSGDGTIKMWDAQTGKELHSLSVQSKGASSVAFSPDGTQIASGSQDNTIKIWNSQSGEELRTLVGHTDTVNCLLFSPDGLRIASGSDDKTIKFWDIVGGEERQTIDTGAGWITCVAFSPDGTQIASASDKLKLWDARTGDEVGTLSGHTDLVHSICFSPDGTRIVSGSKDKTIKVWDAGSGDELRTLISHTDEVSGVAFSPDGKRIASGSRDHSIKIWDAQSGDELRTLTGHIFPVTSVAFSPDGTQIASGSQDKTIKVWDAKSGKELQTLIGNTDGVSGLAFSPDGAQIASQNGLAIIIWDSRNAKELRTLSGHASSVTCMAFSPDGTRIVSASVDKTIKIWDTGSGEELRTLNGHTGWFNSLAFSPDGRLVASAIENTIKLWQPQSGEELRVLTGHTRIVTCAVLSPDGTRIATGSRDKTIKLWDARSGEELRTLNGHADWVYSVAFSPDGKWIASASADNIIKLWDVQSGVEMRTLTTGTNYSMTVKSFDQDGRQIGEEFSPMSRDARVAFSLDGTRIGSTLVNENQLVWDAASGKSFPPERLASENWPQPSYRQNRSTDGRWLVLPIRNTVALIDLGFKRTPSEKNYRELKAKPNPWWHRNQADRAQEHGDWYASMFHNAWLLKLDPSSLENLDRLHVAHDRWREARRIEPNFSVDNDLTEVKLDPVLPRIVHEMLQKPTDDLINFRQGRE